jgi:hypothetical protein
MYGAWDESNLADFTNGIQKNKFFFLPYDSFPEIVPDA